ncbi:MAG: EpsG family protein [Minwuia sp.]|uniref:EpsG family protein n=1 Tax=Minwuia sp. TaxID=2493630 RepID=UPI003A8A7D76
MIYYFTYAALLSATLIGRSSKDFRNAAYWASLFSLLLFVGFRYNVGCDWSGYFKNYYIADITTYGDALRTLDPGYWALVVTLRRIGAPYEYLNVATATIFFIGLHVLARRQPDPMAFLALCFPILIINMPMSGIRQGAAIGFMCLAFAAFMDRKLISYLSWIILGSTFHSSILVFLFLAPFVAGRLRSLNILAAVVISLPGLYFLMQTDAAALAEERYIDSDLVAAGAAFRLALLTASGIFFLRFLSPAWREEFAEDHKLASIGSWMMIVTIALISVSTVIGDRFGYYLIPVQAMIFARIPFLPLGENRRFYSLLPYAALTLVFVIWTIFSWHFNECYVPYQYNFG